MAKSTNTTAWESVNGSSSPFGASARSAGLPSIAGEPEMGWIFSPKAQGKGLASEAGRAALEWLDARVGPLSVPAIIDLENAPSMRLAERLGFERQADATYRDAQIGYFRRPAR